MWSHFRIIAWAGLPLLDDLAGANAKRRVLLRQPGQSPLLLKAIEPRDRDQVGFAPRRRPPGSGLQAVVDCRPKTGNWHSARVGWAPALRGQQKNAGATEAPAMRVQRNELVIQHSTFNPNPQQQTQRQSPGTGCIHGVQLAEGFPSAARQAAEKGLLLHESPREHPPEAKAQLILSPFRHD